MAQTKFSSLINILLLCNFLFVSVYFLSGDCVLHCVLSADQSIQVNTDDVCGTLHDPTKSSEQKDLFFPQQNKYVIKPSSVSISNSFNISILDFRILLKKDIFAFSIFHPPKPLVFS
ncbi:MAG: hypothetical protein IEMM0008_1366 [bacterium]|nr:MAG: hypothetical protein IEMM0008_1366 [bacterium]